MSSRPHFSLALMNWLKSRLFQMVNPCREDTSSHWVCIPDLHAPCYMITASSISFLQRQLVPFEGCLKLVDIFAPASNHLPLPSAAGSPSPPAPPQREPRPRRSWPALLSGRGLNLACRDFGAPAGDTATVSSRLSGTFQQRGRKLHKKARLLCSRWSSCKTESPSPGARRGAGGRTGSPGRLAASGDEEPSALWAR